MKSLKLFCLAVLLVFSVSVFGGYTQPAPVEITIDTDNNFFAASGDMGSARFADNDVESIGCGIKKYSGGYEWGFCQATDATDHYVFCWTEDTEMLEALSVENDNSYIVFYWTPDSVDEAGDPINDTGECSHIGVSSQSFYTRGNKGKMD